MNALLRVLERPALRPAIVIAAAAAVHLLIAFASFGLRGDIEATFRNSGRFLDDPLMVHGHDAFLVGFPYPPGFLPWLGIARLLHDHTPLPFHALISVPGIAGTLVLAWVAHHAMLWRGRSVGEARLALVATAFGPLLLQVCSWQGHWDVVAFTPAALGLYVWARGGEGRAWKAGLLIGAGAAVKTVPALLVLALLPTARNPREWVTATAVAAAVPIGLLLPFAVANLDGVLSIFAYRGVVGQGGLSLIAQPGLAEPWILHRDVSTVTVGDAAQTAQDLGAPLLLLGLAMFTVAAHRRRLDPFDGAAAILCITYATASNMFAYYLVWLVAILLIGGRIWAALAVQGIGVFAQMLMSRGPALPDLLTVFQVLMIGVTFAAAAAAVVLVKRGRQVTSAA